MHLVDATRERLSQSARAARRAASHVRRHSMSSSTGGSGVRAAISTSVAEEAASATAGWAAHQGRV
jgi:hypothetical protein